MNNNETSFPRQYNDTLDIVEKNMALGLYHRPSYILAQISEEIEEVIIMQFATREEMAEVRHRLDLLFNRLA